MRLKKGQVEPSILRLMKAYKKILININIELFNQQYRSIAESAEMLPAHMDSVRNFIDDTVMVLLKDFNFGKQQAEKMMHHCRPAVERFIFGKLYDKLKLIYQLKY